MSAAAMASGMAALTGLTACGPAPSPSADEPSPAPTEAIDNAREAPTSAGEAPAQAPAVYFTHAVEPAALQAVFDAMGKGLAGKVGVKPSTGEPGGDHYLGADLVSGLVSAVGGTIVECNAACGGPRGSTGARCRVAAGHGFAGIADFRVMDEGGSLSLPVGGGPRLSEGLVGARFPDYDGLLVLSHFKGRAMAGFGGAPKSASMGMASREGKLPVRSAGRSRTGWQGAATPDFLESMADACRAALASQPNTLFVNVTNGLSVGCGCDSRPAPPKVADVGILASTDPVALDRACVDLVHASDDGSADLIARIESLDGQHVLEAAERLGVGSRAYELVEIG